MLVSCKLITAINVEMHSTSNNKSIGTIILTDTKGGLLIKETKKNISSGLHGFHIHKFANCKTKIINNIKVKAGGAGGHFDPGNNNAHLGPYKPGHLGDLPVLSADQANKIKTTVLAPRLSLKKIYNKTMVLHQAGDNYADSPSPLGGGGDRIGCGIINKAN